MAPSDGNLTTRDRTSQTAEVQGRKNPLWQGLPDRLRRTRTLARLSQRRLGQLAGCSNAAVSVIEARKNVPGIDLIERLASALGISASWLAFGPEGMLPFRQRQLTLSEEEAADPHPRPAPHGESGRFTGCGSRIKTIREHLGLTLRELAEGATISYQAIHHVETGVAAPKVETLECVAVALDVPPGWLAFGDEEGVVQR